MNSVEMAMIKIPAHPGREGFTAWRTCAPTMALTEDQPTHARMLKAATGSREEKGVSMICRLICMYS